MASKKPVSNIPEDTLAAYERIIMKFKDVERKGATMPYTSVNGHMFSFIGADGMLALRLPESQHEEFIRKHKTKLCEAHGVVMKEYVAVPGELLQDEAKMTGYFKDSYDYVRSLKPKPTKSVAKKKAENSK
jgi:hypothetical protein